MPTPMRWTYLDTGGGPPGLLGGLPFWEIMEHAKESIERLAMDQEDSFSQRVWWRQQYPLDPLSGQLTPFAPPVQPSNPPAPTLPQTPANPPSNVIAATPADPANNTTATTANPATRSAPATAATPPATEPPATANPKAEPATNPKAESATTPNSTITYTGLEPDEIEISPEELRWEWMLAAPEPNSSQEKVWVPDASKQVHKTTSTSRTSNSCIQFIQQRSSLLGTTGTHTTQQSPAEHHYQLLQPKPVPAVPTPRPGVVQFGEGQMKIARLAIAYHQSDWIHTDQLVEQYAGELPSWEPSPETERWLSKVVKRSQFPADLFQCGSQGPHLWWGPGASTKVQHAVSWQSWVEKKGLVLSQLLELSAHGALNLNIST